MINEPGPVLQDRQLPTCEPVWQDEPHPLRKGATKETTPEIHLAEKSISHTATVWGGESSDQSEPFFKRLLYNGLIL